MLKLNFNPFPKLFTERLKLRKITLRDTQAIYELRSDNRVLEFLDRAPAKNLDDAQNFIKIISKGIKRNENITWGISQKNKAKLIGTIGYWHIMPEHFRAEIGYTLHPDFQKKGYMSEAMHCVLDFGFNIMKLHSIEGNVNPNNIASIKVLEKFGFLKEAYFKENYYFNGKFLDSEIYSLLEQNWNK